MATAFNVTNTPSFANPAADGWLRTPNFGADHRVSRSSVAEDSASRSAGVLAANNKLAGSSTSLDPAFLAMYEQPPFPLTSFHEN